MEALLTVWTKIRQTSRQMIDSKTIAIALFFYALGGVGSILTGLLDSDLYEIFSVQVILLFSFIVGPIIVIFLQFIVAGVVLLFGKILKGSGTFMGIYKVLSLGYIPYIVLIPFYVVWLLIDPKGLMMTDVEPNTAISIITVILSLIMGIYSIVIFVIGVSEAHRFSIWKSIFTLVIPALIIVLLLFVIIIVIIGLFVGIGSAI
ncbi:MAG: YIP1 family protein [Lysinibacillus sp.]